MWWYSNEVIGTDGLIEISEREKYLNDKDIDSTLKLLKSIDPVKARKTQEHFEANHEVWRRAYLKDICLNQISPSLIYGV
jgi:hypothetical protein